MLIPKRKWLFGGRRICREESGTPSTIIYTRWSSRHGGLRYHAPMIRRAALSKCSYNYSRYIYPYHVWHYIHFSGFFASHICTPATMTRQTGSDPSPNTLSPPHHTLPFYFWAAFVGPGLDGCPPWPPTIARLDPYHGLTPRQVSGLPWPSNLVPPWSRLWTALVHAFGPPWTTRPSPQKCQAGKELYNQFAVDTGNALLKQSSRTYCTKEYCDSEVDRGWPSVRHTC